MKDSVPIDCTSISPQPNDPDKRLWLIATGVAGVVGTIATSVPFVSSFGPSERAYAAGRPVVVVLSDIPPGGSYPVVWRGTPFLWVRLSPCSFSHLSLH